MQWGPDASGRYGTDDSGANQGMPRIVGHNWKAKRGKKKFLQEVKMELGHADSLTTSQD